MASYYSVIRYVPNPVADERMNIGIVVYGRDGVKTHFTKRWQRVRGFGAEDIGFLREFARELENPQASLPHFTGKRVLWDASAIAAAIKTWHQSIQFSEPRASTKDPDALLHDLAKRFLSDEGVVRSRGRDKRSAAALGYRQLRTALEQKLQDKPVESIVSRTGVVEGQHELHKFDLVVRNGKLVMAAQAISFEPHDASEIGRDVDGAVWSISDIRRKDPSAPAAVLVLPPKSASKQFDRLRRLADGLKFRIVREAGVTNWARQVAAQVHP